MSPEASPRQVLVVGIGTGNPKHLTVEAIEALQRAQVIFIPRKGAEKTELADLRHEICRLYTSPDRTRIVEYDVPRRRDTGPYRDGVDDWHDRLATIFAALFEAELPQGSVGAFLVWGDPSLYDSTLRILERALPRTPGFFEIEVIPGLTSLQVLAAKHRTTLNEIGESFTVTTGRRLTDGLPGTPSAAVMLTAGHELRSVTEDVDVFWGAYVGMEAEQLLAGRLSDILDEIEATRQRLREEHGWVMDAYILKRRQP